jgi:hypothetical protein
MTLAAILGVSLLLALSPSGKALVMLLPGTAQAADARQDSSQADSSQQSPAPPAAAPEDGSSSAQSAPQAKPGAETHGEQAPPPETPPKTSKPASGTKTSSPNSPARKSTATKTTKHHRKHSKKPPLGAEPPKAETPKVVVPNGGASDPSVQLAPSLSRQQAADQRQDTNELLASTESNLKAIAGHELQASQRDMVKQIEQYMAQAKEATKAGDLERAHNLALKAQLLSKELVKH